MKLLITTILLLSISSCVPPEPAPEQTIFNNDYTSVDIPAEPAKPAISIVKPFNGDYPLNQGFTGGHNGIDWGCHYYTDILAADAGRVIVTKDDLYGNHIWIEHEWGKTLYAHLHSWMYVESGNWVEKGQPLAQSGDTGDSFDHTVSPPVRSPHLHFGMQINGQWVNPLNYIEGEI